ncbi:MAG: MltA-interacting MipA family protein [Desulfatitalea sp.]|nr:MltA-interacting MipA family protein [Desulfatitalea sp.]NNJ98957.1 MltA-interacting MipA family protein [Desulfatitalea sp.]
MKRLIPVIVLAIMLTGNSAIAAEATATLDLNSAYVWRGITINDTWVAQPSVDVASDKGFGFNVWGNFDFDDEYAEGFLGKNDFSEVDLTVYYNTTVDKVDLGIGLIEYLFPNAGTGNTRELYASVGMGIIDGLSAGLTIYWDFDEHHGFYTDLNLTYGYDINEQLGLEVGGNIAYATEEFARWYGLNETLEAGFYNYGLSLCLNYSLTEVISVGANINYVGTMDEDALPEAKNNGGTGVDTEVFGGVSVSYAF